MKPAQRQVLRRCRKIKSWHETDLRLNQHQLTPPKGCLGHRLRITGLQLQRAGVPLNNIHRDIDVSGTTGTRKRRVVIGSIDVWLARKPQWWLSTESADIDQTQSGPSTNCGDREVKLGSPTGSEKERGAVITVMTMEETILQTFIGRTYLGGPSANPFSNVPYHATNYGYTTLAFAKSVQIGNI